MTERKLCSMCTEYAKGVRCENKDTCDLVKVEKEVKKMKLMITDTNGNKMYYGGRRKDGSYKITSSASDAFSFSPRAKGSMNQVWGNPQKQYPDYKFEYVD